MALGVVVDFIGTPLAAAPPFTVQFTDLSEVTDGFIRLWFWEFGDGEVSTEQNPTHEYDGDGGESFNVKLAVVVTSGEFDVLAESINLAISAGSGSIEQSGIGDTEPEAWEAFIGASPTGGNLTNASHRLSRTGGISRQYKNVTADITVVSTGPQPAGVINILTCSPADFEEFAGVANAGAGSVGYSNNDIRQFHHLVEGVIQSVPIPFSVSVTPIGNLPDTVTTNYQTGLDVSWTLVTYLSNGTQKADTETKNQYITIGTPPIAAFDASPKQGPNPLPVQFENLSTPAVGVETIYTWKKRIAGSGDPFTTFSTDENPLEIFTK